MLRWLGNLLLLLSRRAGLPVTLRLLLLLLLTRRLSLLRLLRLTLRLGLFLPLLLRFGPRLRSGLSRGFLTRRFLARCRLRCRLTGFLLARLRICRRPLWCRGCLLRLLLTGLRPRVRLLVRSRLPLIRSGLPRHAGLLRILLLSRLALLVPLRG